VLTILLIKNTSNSNGGGQLKYGIQYFEYFLRLIFFFVDP